MARKAKVELFEGKDGWRFRKKAANGEITLTGEAYSDKDGAKSAAEREFPELEIVEVVVSEPEQPTE